MWPLRHCSSERTILPKLHQASNSKTIASSLIQIFHSRKHQKRCFLNLMTVTFCYSNTGSQKYTFHLNISGLSEVWTMRGNELLLVHDVKYRTQKSVLLLQVHNTTFVQGGKSTYGSIRHPTYWRKEKRTKSTESLQEAVKNNKDTGRIRRMDAEQNWGSSSCHHLRSAGL